VELHLDPRNRAVVDGIGTVAAASAANGSENRAL
jgi:hypothetical protein